MAAVTVCSDFLEPKKIKSVTASIVSPSISYEVMGLDAMILVFWPEVTQSFKSGKEYIKAAYCHPAYLTYMQNTSWETLGWMKHKLESRLPGEISITLDMQTAPLVWQKAKKNEPLDESERVE